MIVHGASNSSAKLRLGWQNDSDALVSSKKKRKSKEFQKLFQKRNP